MLRLASSILTVTTYRRANQESYGSAVRTS
jgi:hypothetical protein